MKLSRHGIPADTNRFGDYVVIRGHPPRKPTEYRILLQLLTRQNDGFSWGERKNETVD